MTKLTPSQKELSTQGGEFWKFPKWGIASLVQMSSARPKCCSALPKPSSLKGIAFVCCFCVSQAFSDVVRYTLSKRKTFRRFEGEVWSNIYMMPPLGCGLSGLRHVCMIVRCTVRWKIFAFDAIHKHCTQCSARSYLLTKWLVQDKEIRLTSRNKAHFLRLVFRNQHRHFATCTNFCFEGFPARNRQLQGGSKYEIHTCLAT